MLERRPSFIWACWWVLTKEARVEWRSKARVQATVFYAVLTLIMLSTATGLAGPSLKSQAAPATLWLAVMIASAVSLSASMQTELEHRAIDGLRLLPVAAEAVFLGKSLFSALFLFLTSSLLFPLCLVLFSGELTLSWWKLGLVLLLGSGAVAAPGTLYASFAAQTRAREVVFPLLLFPFIIPILLLASGATQMAMYGDAMGSFWPYLRFLALSNLLVWPLGALLFRAILD